MANRTVSQSVEWQAHSDRSIQPFRIDVSDRELNLLRERLSRTRWPDAFSDVGWDYGVPLDYVRSLVEHWLTRYDWRSWEARINQYDQFRTTIDGQNIHFLHVRSTEPHALPLILRTAGRDPWSNTWM